MSALTSGQSLSQRFELIRPLGRGGMAQVWLVLDRELDERVVAKILPAGASEDLVELLRRECRNARRLVHPNIVRVYDFHHGGGTHFITMAHVDGDDLGQLRGKPPFEILQVVLPVADALSYAHSLGIVHRDLKASNVLRDPSGQPVLLDFGIADLLETAGGTLAGGGSRYSISPQQLAGERPQPADDIYAFGVLLYELITGRPPFWPEITEERIRSEEPEPPCSAFPLPPALEALVASMLAKSPSERPQGMAAVANELRAILEDHDGPANETIPPPDPQRSDVRLTPPPRVEPIRPVTPRKTPVPTRQAAPASGRKRRARLWSGLATVAILGLIVLGVFYFLPWVAERFGGRGQQEESVVAGTPPPVPGVEAEAEPPAARNDPRDDPYQEERARRAMARVLQLTALLDEKGASVWGAEDLAAATSQVERADDQLASAEYVAAEESYAQAIRMLERLEDRSREIRDRALADGRQALVEGDAVAAAAAFGMVARIEPANREAAAGLRRADVLDEVLERLRSAAGSERKGDLTAAERGYRAALDLDPLSRSAREGLARVQSRIGNEAFAQTMSEGLAALNRGDYAAAEEAFRRADGVRPGSPEVADGLAQAAQSRRLEAIARHRGKAIELEDAEQWQSAAEQYEAVLQLDPAIRFAQDGKARCLVRAHLAERMTFHLSNPDRLSSDAVFEEVSNLLEDAMSVEPFGPRHQEQVARLAELVERSGKPVRVRLESDNLTSVTVYKVGRLGTFLQRELELRPGKYTVVGSRRGYRDIRQTLVIVAGQVPAPVIVRCEEKI